MQPLTLLRMEVTHKENKDIHRIIDHKVEYPFLSIPFDQNKRLITFFITEILSKVLREEEPDPELFDFIFESVRVLDGNIPGLYNFHLFFLFHLSRFLGFGVRYPEKKDFKYFDLKNSEYLYLEPDHPYFISGGVLKNWVALTELEADGLDKLVLSGESRKNMIDALITYFELHIMNFGTLKSLKVLRSLF
jgi:DNA repair protein RecO (recombination protein O)